MPGTDGGTIMWMTQQPKFVCIICLGYDHWWLISISNHSQIFPNLCIYNWGGFMKMIFEQRTELHLSDELSTAGNLIYSLKLSYFEI